MKLKLLIFSIVSCILTSQTFASQEKDSVNLIDQVLVGPQTGRWQIIDIPDAWLKRYWQNTTFRDLYLVLRGPHQNDLGYYSPCAAPSRLLLGVENRTGEREEYLLTCFDVCSSNDNEKSVFKNLWARNTYLEGITAQLLVNGKIEIIEHYKEQLGIDRNKIKDINFVEKNKYGRETRRRSQQISVGSLKTAIKKSRGKSCLNDG